MKEHAQTGFSLIELLIASAIVVILLSLAVPSFTTLTMNKRMTTQANEFISTLALARSQALKRVTRVTVCSSTGISCTGSGGWEQGWIVFVDSNNNAQVNDGEDILQVQSALDGGNTLRGSTNVANYISYVAGGTTKLTSGGFQAGTFALCDDRGSGVNAQTIKISVTGRSRVEETTVTCAL
jgi:type IV fimbrial biogenesis protein FimT